MHLIDRLDRGGDAHGHRLARPLGRIAAHPGPTAEAERGGKFLGQELLLGPQPFGAAGIAELLGVGELVDQFT